MHLKSDGTEVFTEPYRKERVNSITDMKENFLQGKHINQYRKLSTNDVEDSDSSQYYSQLDLTEIVDQSEPVEHTDTDELPCDQMDAPSDVDIDLINQINEAKNGQTEPSLKECNIFEKPEHKNENISDLLKIPTARLEAEADSNIITILEEQRKDPVLKTVRIWVREKLKSEKSPEIRQSKALLAYYNQFENLFIHPETEVLCFNERSHGTDTMGTKICVPLSLILPLFNLAHNHQLAGHMGKDKTLYNLKRFFFCPGCYKWVSSLIADCLNCQKNKSKRHDLNSAPLEKWGETVCIPLHTVHIDHKGPLNPPSKGKRHCLVVVDAFTRFIQVYPVTNAQDTIEAMEKFVVTFGIPQKLVYDKGSSFLNSDFTNWAKELAITHAPRTAYSPWTNGKVEIQNKHLTRYFRSFLQNSGKNWAESASKFAFSHNTTANYSTSMTPYKMVFGYKPQIPLSLKLGLLRNLDLRCSFQFCENLPAHTHSTQDTENKAIARLLLPPVSCDLLARENTFKKIYCDAYQKSLETTARAHKYRNQYRLAKPLSLNQKVLLESHSQPLNMSKKLCQLRQGPYSVLKQITGVNYEIALDTDPSFTLVAHRNHLIEYFPKEEKLPKLLAAYQNPTKETFYQNIDQKRLQKLNVPRKANRTFASFLTKSRICRITTSLIPVIYCLHSRLWVRPRQNS